MTNVMTNVAFSYARINEVLNSSQGICVKLLPKEMINITLILDIRCIGAETFPFFSKFK